MWRVTKARAMRDKRMSKDIHVHPYGMHTASRIQSSPDCDDLYTMHSNVKGLKPGEDSIRENYHTGAYKQNATW